MKRMTDEKLDRMLSSYCKAEPEAEFSFTRPAVSGRKNAFVPVWLSLNRRLAAALSLVAVSALSLALYFLFGNKIDTPIVTAPSSQSTAPTDEIVNDATNPYFDMDEFTEETQIGAMIPTTSTGTQAEGSAPTAGQRPTSPAVKPTEKATAPTVKPTSRAADPTSPSAKPTSPAVNPTSPSVKPTEPEKATQPPTNAPVKPTAPPYVPPTEPDETEPPTDGGGDEPSYEVPTEENPYWWLTFTDSFSPDRLPEGGTVYCRVYDAVGRALGDSDRFSQEHVAQVLNRTKKGVYVSYHVPEGVVTRAGEYRYEFYDANGTVLIGNWASVE